MHELIKAGVLVVMAKTPPKMVNGKERKQITAFIVEVDSPGLEITYRCHFMGLRALYNGIVKFKDVRVPRENMIAEGRQGIESRADHFEHGPPNDSGRLRGVVETAARDLPKVGERTGAMGRADRAALGHRRKDCRDGRQHFRHGSDDFSHFRAGRSKSRRPADRNRDVQNVGTEMTWQIADDAMQVRGGRGYETAQSLAGRGEEPIAVERFLRDCRINMIFEGSSEIMRLFIAREALDPHLKVGGAIFNTQLPMSERVEIDVQLRQILRPWYPKQWLGGGAGKLEGLHEDLRAHVDYGARTSKRLARGFFHAMARFGPKLDREQLLLSRFVGIATELFAMSATCSFAQRK